MLRLARRDLTTQARPSGTDALARCTPHSQTSGPETMIRAELASVARAKSGDRRCATQQCNHDASARTLAGGDLAGYDSPRCQEGEGGRAHPTQCTPAAPLRTGDARGLRTRLGDATCRHMPSLSMPAAVPARSLLSLAHATLQPQHGNVPHLSPSSREVGRGTLPPVPSCGGHPGVGAQPAPASSHGVAGGIPSPGRGLDPPRLGPGRRAAAFARSGTGPQPQPQPQPQLLPRQPLHEPPAWISRSRAWSRRRRQRRPCSTPRWSQTARRQGWQGRQRRTQRWTRTRFRQRWRQGHGQRWRPCRRARGSGRMGGRRSGSCRRPQHALKGGPAPTDIHKEFLTLVHLPGRAYGTGGKANWPWILGKKECTLRWAFQGHVEGLSRLLAALARRPANFLWTSETRKRSRGRRLPTPGALRIARYLALHTTQQSPIECTRTADQHHPHSGRRVGEASHPGPPNERAADTAPEPPSVAARQRRARALHALAQMRLLPAAPPSPAASIFRHAGRRHAVRFTSCYPATGSSRAAASGRCCTNIVRRGDARVHTTTIPARRDGPAMAGCPPAEHDARPKMLVAFRAVAACGRRASHSRGG